MPTLDTTLDRYRPSHRQLALWQRREPALARHSFLRLRHRQLDPTVSYVTKDAVLAAVIRTSTADPDAIVALAACLLPGLRAAARKRCRHVDEDEAMARLVGALVGEVGRYDVDRHPRCVARRLLGATTDAVRTTHRADVRWVARTCALDADIHALPVSDPQYVGPPLLRRAMDAHVVQPDDAWLVAATRAAGVPIAEAAEALAISYEAAKKRRQRAEASLRRWAIEGGPPLVVHTRLVGGVAASLGPVTLLTDCGPHHRPTPDRLVTEDGGR